MIRHEKENKKFWLECDCGAHDISVDADSYFGSIDLAFWQLGSYLFKYSIKNRFLFAWNMITTGRVYSDIEILKVQSIKYLFMIIVVCVSMMWKEPLFQDLG